MIDKQTLLSNIDDVIVTPSKNPESVTTNTSQLSIKPNSPKLTRKQKAYVTEILKNPAISGTQAVINAGYNVSTRHTAEVISSENMRKPEITQYLENHLLNSEKTMVEVMEISKEYAKSGSKEGAAYASNAIAASKDIQDRLKGKARQITEVQSTAVSISIDMSTQHTTEVE